MGYKKYVLDVAGVHQLIRSPPAVEELIMLGIPDLDPVGYTELLRSGMAELADSPEIMECAEVQGGEDFRNRHPGGRVTLQFQRDSSPNDQWIVQYAATGSRAGDTLLMSTSIGKPVNAAIQSPTVSVRH